MTLDDATRRAEEIQKLLAPFCIPDRCIVVGSVRRKKPDPKDIELCLMPDLTDQVKFDAIKKILLEGRIGIVETGMFPARYTRLKGSICNIDLFWQSRETWGLNVFIRTGCDDFVKRALAHWKKLTGGGYADGARLFDAEHKIRPTPTELSVFEALECKFIPPERRVPR